MDLPHMSKEEAMSLAGLRKWMILAAVFGLLASVAPLFAVTGGLTGKATDEQGNPMVGYPIIIERQEVKGVYKTKTNKKGEYIYIGLPIGNYKVTLQSPSGETVFFLSRHVETGDPTEVNFDMAKERALQKQQQEKALAENPELQKQVKEQEKEQKEFSNLKQFFEQGQTLYNSKQYTEAAAVFEQALPLAKGGNLPVVLARLAECYHKARQFDKAVEDFQKAIAANPSDATLYNNLGGVYADMGKTAEAAAEFQKAAETDPAQASRYYYNYGAVMYNTGKMDEAAAAFKKATEIDANYADAYFMQGRALMGKLTLDPKTGKVIAPPGTTEALEAYLKLEPQGKYAADAQGMLQTITGQIQTQYKVEKKKKK
jgi:tetratricopeptide (TPR) repeat protein